MSPPKSEPTAAAGPFSLACSLSNQPSFGRAFIASANLALDSRSFCEARAMLKARRRPAGQVQQRHSRSMKPSLHLRHPNLR